MWFDARAALARFEGGAHPAPETHDRLNSLNSQSPAVQPRNLTAQPAPPQFAGFAGFARPQRAETVPMTERVKARAAALPFAPRTCALCGLADWQVSLTDTKRRTLHVACWRAEQEARER
jgi:hypothetical protein